MKNAFSLVFILMACSTKLCLGQNTPENTRIGKSLPNPVPLSPNAASFIKYGNYEVSHYTGVPEISIPLAAATSGKLSIPISLSYHAGGIKYKDQAGWVGLGWSVVAGGQISREINGHPDESTYLGTPIPADIQMCRDAEYIKGMDNGWHDGQADVFSYNAAGLGSGKFVLGQTGQPTMFIPFSNVKLNYAINSAYQIVDLKMIGSNGVNYKFADVELSSSTVMENTNVISSGAVTWNLTEIKDPNSDDLIKINYQPIGSNSVIDYSEVWRITDNCQSGTGWPECGSYDTYPFPYNKELITAARGIDFIEHEGGKIVFVKGELRADQPSNLLDKIIVYSLLNGQYKLLKTYDFEYSYYKNNAGNINLRLKLDKLLVKDENGAIVEQHQFTYRTNTFSWDHPSSSKSIDYWGFFNGKPNQYLTPPVTFSYNNYGTLYNLTLGNADRNSDTTLMKEGILERIDYPTRGYTKFHFAPHLYKRWDGATGYGGGLRIRKIESFDGVDVNPSLIKTYKYGELEDGYGVPLFEAEYLFGSYLMTTSFYSKVDAISFWKNRKRVIYSNPTIDWSGTAGSSVVYPFITEYYLGHNAGNIGKIKYVYDGGVVKTDGIHSIGEGSGKYHKTRYDWQRGFLTKKTVFDKIGNNLQSTENQYQVLNESHLFKSVGVYKLYEYDGVYPQNTCANLSGYDEMEFVASNLEIPSGVVMLLKSTESQCENGNLSKCISFDESYIYDNTSLQVMQKTRDIGDSKSQITKYKYPFSYTFNGSETANALGVKKLKDMNLISVPIEEYNIAKEGSTSNVIGGLVTTFKTSPSNPSYVSPDVSYQLETGSSVPEGSYATTGLTSSSITMDSRYKPSINVFQDLKGNIIQAQQTNNHFIGYQWGYDNTLPVAEVSNAQNNKHIIYTQGNSTSTISMGGPTPSVTLNRTITVGYSGTVSLKLGVSGNPAFVTYASYTSTTLGNASNITLAKNVSCGSAPIIATFNNVPAGSHTITITLTTPTGGVSSLGACGQIDFPDLIPSTTGITEFFNENFEEGTATGVATPHTGKKYLVGDYTTTFIMPNTRTYTIEYWYLSGSTWVYATAPYTNGMVLTLGTAIDDVRIYPGDARMKTYTYEPGIGISSMIDENGTTLYYNYDSFGRLSQIKNEKGGIEKQYSYNYKN